jgi:nitrite reductase/ring-hydroxylating ferredoxin subunit
MSNVTFLKRNIFQRVFGVPATPLPKDRGCWSYSDGRLTVDLARAPELQEAGGALRCEGGGLPGRVLIVRGEGGEFRAFRNRCTHMGHRRLDPLPGTTMVQCCSVGKSTYHADGAKVYGPAPEPIVTYSTESQGDRLIVTIG